MQKPIRSKGAKTHLLRACFRIFDIYKIILSAYLTEEK
jgi:hypothetical protein